MLVYKAMYKFLDDGIHAEVLDFPGAITCAGDLETARKLLSSALQDMAEECLLRGESLPKPDESITDPEADIEEPVYLLLKASSHVETVPRNTVS